jgi:hypothetical protein
VVIAVADGRDPKDIEAQGRGATGAVVATQQEADAAIDDELAR